MAMQIDKKTIFTVIGVLFGLGGIYYMTSSVIPRVMVTMTKAAPATKVSMTSTRVIGARLLAKADGVDKCVVNVFVMDDSGKGVKGKTVELSGADDIKALDTMTDGNGMIGFEIRSATAGQYKLAALIEGVELDKTVTVTFR